MKYTKKVSILLIAVISILTFSGCSKKNKPSKAIEEDGIYGSWAYIHDKETEVAVFYKDGTAKYENKDYDFKCDNEFISLTDKNGDTQKMRYTLDDEGMYLYINTTYLYDGDGKPDGLVGVWSCKEKNWSFEFTDKGTFKEDGYFPGIYTVDEDKSTFKLAYTDHFEDTECYYSIDNDQLSIEYPWRMVRTVRK